MRNSVFTTDKPVPPDWRYRTAGPRLFANVIDGMVHVPFYLLATFALDYIHAMPNLLAALLFVVGVLGFYAYSIVGHARTGRTLGKWALRIRLVHNQESVPGWWLAVSHDLPGLVFSSAIGLLAIVAILLGGNPYKYGSWRWTAHTTTLALVTPWFWLGLRWIGQALRPPVAPNLEHMTGTIVLRTKVVGVRTYGVASFFAGLLMVVVYVQAWGAWRMYLVPEYTFEVNPLIQRTWYHQYKDDPPIRLTMTATSNAEDGAVGSWLKLDSITADTGEELLSFQPLLLADLDKEQNAGFWGHQDGNIVTHKVRVGRFPVNMNSVTVRGEMNVMKGTKPVTKVFPHVYLEEGLHFRVRDATMTIVDVRPEERSGNVLMTLEFVRPDFLPTALEFVGVSGQSYVCSLYHLNYPAYLKWQHSGSDRFQMAILVPAVSGRFDLHLDYLLPIEPRTLKIDEKVPVINLAEEGLSEFDRMQVGAFLELRRPSNDEWGRPLHANKPAEVIMSASPPYTTYGPGNEGFSVDLTAHAEHPGPGISADMRLTSISDDLGHEYLADYPWVSNTIRHFWFFGGDYVWKDGRSFMKDNMHFSLHLSPPPMPAAEEITLNGVLRIAYGSDLATTEREILPGASTTLEFDGFSLIFDGSRRGSTGIRVRGNRGLLQELSFVKSSGESVETITLPTFYFTDIETYLTEDEEERESYPSSTLRITHYKQSYYRDFPFEMTVPLRVGGDEPVARVVLGATP